MSDPASPLPKTITLSGRAVTLALLAVLVLVCVVVGWVSLEYGKFAESRRVTEKAWREIAEQLESRYQILDATLASMQNEQTPTAPNQSASSVDRTWINQWRNARSTFQGSFGAARQAVAAVELETLLATMLEKTHDGSGVAVKEQLRNTDTPELRSAARRYQEAAEDQLARSRTLGLRVLRIILVIPPPVNFSLVTLPN